MTLGKRIKEKKASLFLENEQKLSYKCVFTALQYLALYWKDFSNAIFMNIVSSSLVGQAGRLNNLWAIVCSRLNFLDS